jgi:hypothetical protein
LVKAESILRTNVPKCSSPSVPKSADWFDQFRAIRGAIVHENANLISFGIKKGEPVLWALFKSGIKDVLTVIPFVVNENGVMNFERYAAYHMFRVYALLHSFGEILYQMTSINRSQIKSAARSHGGIKVIHAWMTELRDHLQAAPTPVLSKGKRNDKDRS